MQTHNDTPTHCHRNIQPLTEYKQERHCNDSLGPTASSSPSWSIILSWSTNSASGEMRVKHLAWQPDRLRKQRMARQQPKSQLPTDPSWYSIDQKWSNKASNTQNTFSFWSRRRSTTDGKQEAHVVYSDQQFKVMSGQQGCQLKRGC